MHSEVIFADFYAELGIDAAAYPRVRKKEMTTLCVKIRENHFAMHCRIDPRRHYVET